MLGWLSLLRRTVTGLTAAATATMVLAVPAAVGGSSGSAYALSLTQPASDRYEDRIVYWTNVKRKRHGLRPVRKGVCPDRYAESWSRRLAASGTFEHQDLTRLLTCDGVRLAGENLARGNFTPRQMVNAWMRSPGHRANLLKRTYTRIGVGSYRSLDDGRMYTAQTFTG